MSRAYWRQKIGLVWGDEDGPIDWVQYDGPIADTVAVATPGLVTLQTPRCECVENGHVCRACRERNEKWRNPLDGANVP